MPRRRRVSPSKVWPSKNALIGMRGSNDPRRSPTPRAAFLLTETILPYSSRDDATEKTSVRCRISIGWEQVVSDLSKRRGAVACPRCKAPMEEVVTIAPAQGDPGPLRHEHPDAASGCGRLKMKNPGGAGGKTRGR